MFECLDFCTKTEDFKSYRMFLKIHFVRLSNCTPLFKQTLCKVCAILVLLFSQAESSWAAELS